MPDNEYLATLKKLERLLIRSANLKMGSDAMV